MHNSGEKKAGKRNHVDKIWGFSCVVGLKMHKLFQVVKGDVRSVLRMSKLLFLLSSFMRRCSENKMNYRILLVSIAINIVSNINWANAPNVRLYFSISAVHQPFLYFDLYLNTAYAARYVYFTFL